MMMIEVSLPPECWSTFTKKVENSGTKIMKIIAIKAKPTKCYLPNSKVWEIKCFCFCIGHIWSVTKCYFPLTSALNQKQFKHWIILLKNLWFVLSWLLFSFWFLKKAAEWKNDTVCPPAFAISLCNWFLHY